MAKTTYSDEFKDAVLQTYQSDGPAEAARRHGIHKTTIQRWAKRSGVVTNSGTKKDTEAALDALAARRARIRELLGQRAQEMLDRVGGKYTMVTKAGDVLELDEQPASVCKDLATTAAILIDKLQLMTGEPTERVEHNDLAKDARERLNSRIAGIAASKRTDEAPSKPE